MRPRFEIDYAVQEQRENRKRGGRTREQVEELWLQAEKTAELCAGCFQELSPQCSVTMVYRHIGHRRGGRRLRVPICLDCDLTEERRWSAAWGERAGPGSRQRRVRCVNCRRPMRVWWDNRFIPLPKAKQCCCRDCYRFWRNDRAWERRHRDHQRVCVVCGEKFEPTRHDAKTCSNTCRQRLFRRRHQSRG